MTDTLRPFGVLIFVNRIVAQVPPSAIAVFAHFDQIYGLSFPLGIKHTPLLPVTYIKSGHPECEEDQPETHDYEASVCSLREFTRPGIHDWCVPAPDIVFAFDFGHNG